MCNAVYFQDLLLFSVTKFICTCCLADDEIFLSPAKTKSFFLSFIFLHNYIVILDKITFISIYVHIKHFET